MVSDASFQIKPRPRRLLISILGWGRSGSSVLANVLGSLDGAASLGETRYLWDRGIVENGTCGCGDAFVDCDLWPDLPFNNATLANVGAESAHALAKSIGSQARKAQIPALYSAWARRKYLSSNRARLESLMALYGSAFDRTGSRVLIDASKSPYFALNFLTENRDFDVAFLHLVRDPRAVLHSWKKTKQREDNAIGKQFPKYSSMRSLSQWTFVNSGCNRFAKLAGSNYVRVKYEDFADDWRKALATAAPDLFELSTPATDANHATVAPQHSISGNPARFDTGQITLKPDMSWAGAISATDRRLAATLCRRVARRYGYDLA